MSIWTHITGTIRIDDFNCIINKNNKLDLSKIFIKSTFYNPNEKCNIPNGSEGSLDVEFIDRNDDTEYMRTIAFFGDLRDFDTNDCQDVKKWWFEIPKKLDNCMIRQAVLQIQCEEGYECVLTEKDMDIKN